MQGLKILDTVQEELPVVYSLRFLIRVFKLFNPNDPLLGQSVQTYAWLPSIVQTHRTFIVFSSGDPKDLLIFKVTKCVRLNSGEMCIKWLHKFTPDGRVQLKSWIWVMYLALILLICPVCVSVHLIHVLTSSCTCMYMDLFRPAVLQLSTRCPQTTPPVPVTRRHSNFHLPYSNPCFPAFPNHLTPYIHLLTCFLFSNQLTVYILALVLQSFTRSSSSYGLVVCQPAS